MSGTQLITPEKFIDAFLSIVAKEEDRVASLWEEDKKFTELMLGDKEGILAKIADKLCQEYFREYWTIDAVYFERKHENYFMKRATYAEYLSVAIEHENLAKTSHEEINKLSMLNCPLKVLITYPFYNQKEQLLKKYSDILGKADIFRDFTHERKHLVVFRYLNKDKRNWSFFVYKDGAFTNI